MLSEIVDLFLTPIRYCFELLTAEVWFDAMGVTPLGIACTGLIVCIVMKALLTPVSIGAISSYKARTSSRQAHNTPRQADSHPNRLGSGDKPLLK